jgi:hypothetical protein
MLKGERAEAFLAPGGKRHRVCELCFARAEQVGWIREAGSGEAPTRVPRSEPRRSRLGRLRRRPEREPGSEPSNEEPAGDNGPLVAEGDSPPPWQRKDPRHVRAVPTTAEVKVERALELFNGSEHHKTVAGLLRTLGTPWVTALPDLDLPSAVTVLVAWELSWYRFRIDLGDEADPVVLLDKGEELGDIEEPLRDWNATVEADGRLVTNVGTER